MLPHLPPSSTRLQSAQLFVSLLLLMMVGIAAACSSTASSEDAAAAPTPTSAPTSTATAAPPTAAPTPQPTATPRPTATPFPTVTPTPEPDIAAVVSERGTTHGLPDLASLGDCTAVNTDPLVVGLNCEPDALITAPLPGRVVFASGLSHPAAGSSAPAHDDAIQWEQPSGESPIVVVDHGSIGGHRTVMSVFSKVQNLTPSAVLGQTVDLKTPVATAGPNTTWTLLIDDRPFGVPSPPSPSFPFEDDLADAAALARRIQEPVDPECGFNPGVSSGIPNASRGYRNGTHRGIDFSCSARGFNTYAAMDGTVLVAVSGYVDASPSNRNALLQSTATAGFTPRWTLNMLYGNYVIVEHEPVNGKETVTLYAHLETVDAAVVPGAEVTAGQLIGEIGNRGTNASAMDPAARFPGNLHLHWELYVGGTYLGAGKSISETQQIYMALFDPTE